MPFDLNLVWFILLGILLIGYAILDGFDLGVGILHPIARTDTERRLFMNSIGPIWDGNEVWLITFGGALFAAFPEAYATVFSGFYLAFMLLLLALIFRAVSLEFRSKNKSTLWRAFWDYAFFGSSLLATLLFGVAVGNSIVGLPLDQNGIYLGGFWNLISVYTVLTGLLAVSMFAMHGAIYLYLKTEGQVQERLQPWMWRLWGIFLTLYILATIMTLVEVPEAAQNVRDYPWAALVVILSVLGIANIPRTLFNKKYGQAFLSSAATIAGLSGLFMLALFPNLVVASNDPEMGSVVTNSLTIYNAASSQKTLGIMFLIAVLGMPLVLLYTSAVYWSFRGKVTLGEHSY